MDYALRPLVREEDEAGTWVGPLPDGPIMLLAGAGAQVFDVLEESGGRLDRDRLVEEVLERFENAPPDAAQEILRFVDELVESGVLEAAPPAPNPPPEPNPARADETLVVGVAGEEIELVFTPGLAELAARARVLWSHLLVDAEADDASTPGPSDSTRESAPTRSRRRYAARVRDSGASHAAEGVERAPAAAPGPGSGAALRVLPMGPQGTYALSGDITRALIERLRGRRLLLHAAAVELPGIGVVVLVGPSGAGKSTAAETLAREGVYLTDELTILDPEDLTLSAYPKPVSHLDHGAEHATKRDHALPSLGLVPGSLAAAPSHVVILERRDPSDAARASSIERIPLREALSELIGQSSSLWMVPAGLSALAALLERTGGALRVRYEEAEELPGLLARIPAPAPESATPIPVPAEFAAPGPGEWAVVRFVQALATDDGIQVLFDGRAVHAPALAGLVWEELLEAGPTTVDVIAQRLEVQLGAHPEARDLVETSLGMLLSEGCVRRA